MFPPGVERYLHEIARVLRPGTGRCLISFFLLDPESEDAIRSRRSEYRFAHRSDSHAIEDPQRPEDAVAFEESWVRRTYAEAGLEITDIHRGCWCERQDCLSFQDMVVARPAAESR